MMQSSPVSSRNRLLAALSPPDLALLRPDLEPTPLALRQILETANEPITHSYFIEHGLASVVAGRRKRIEVGLVGFEGMTGLAVVLGSDRSPNENFIQVAGEGSRIASDKLRAAIGRSQSLQRVLLEFANTFLNQVSTTALSNGTASIEERLARWLLMAHDRLEDDEIPLTHEFLSLMLGVRRAGVTVALNALERKGVTRLMRGHILIMDREELKETANGIYDEPEI
jgi:CRP-like cAMP-binding protein